MRRAESDVVLNVEGLYAGYDRLRVLADVSMEVGFEETVCVLGANGAGKTTLLRAIAGVLRPRGGVVTLHGRRIDGRDAYELARSGIGHVPSGCELFADLTVDDNLILGGRGSSRSRRGELRRRVLELFPSLRPLVQRRAGTLSGGEQQMLAIGRALMTEPTLLLLDEPSTGLAPTIVRSLFASLAQLMGDGGLSIVLVDQNVSLALSLAQRAYVLQHGRCVLDGRASELKGNDRLIRTYLG